VSVILTKKLQFPKSCQPSQLRHNRFLLRDDPYPSAQIQTDCEATQVGLINQHPEARPTHRPASAWGCVRMLTACNTTAQKVYVKTGSYVTIYQKSNLTVRRHICHKTWQRLGPHSGQPPTPRRQHHIRRPRGAVSNPVVSKKWYIHSRKTPITAPTQ